MAAGYEVRPLSAVTPAEAASLLEVCGMDSRYGRHEKARIWEWKHHKNPAGRSLGMAAYSDGSRELIGLRPFMRWQLVDGSGSSLPAVRAVDAVVHPEFRRRGVFSELTKTALVELAGHDIAVVFNTPNSSSGPGNRRMGWRLFGHPLLFVRLREPLRWVSGQSPMRQPSSAPQHVLPASWPPYRDVHSRLAGARRLPYPKEGVRVAKTSEFLWWRYGTHPSLEYRVVEMCDECGASSIAVVHEDHRRSARGVAIVEVWGRDKPPGFAGVRKLIRKIISECEADYLVAGQAQASALAWLSSSFVPVPWRNVYFAIRPVLDDYAGLSGADRRAAWALTLGDLEGF